MFQWLRVKTQIYDTTHSYVLIILLSILIIVMLQNYLLE